MFDLLLNLVFCTSYIGLTWLSIGERGADKNSAAPPPPPFSYQALDFGLAILLLLQWIPHVTFTLFPFTELQSTWSMATLLSTLSVLWVFFIPNLKGTFLEGGNVVFLYPFRFWRLHGSISRCFPGNVKSSLNLLMNNCFSW